MIAYIEGTLTHKDPTYLIVETNGIGYQVKISLNTYARLKNESRFKVFTYLHIKEDGHTLFGFAEELEKKIFLELISVNGVGPGTAMMMLSSLSPAEVQQAIASEDIRTIQSVKGIGAKGAQRIILELKDKMRKEQLSPDTKTISSGGHNTIRSEALSALVTLGFPKADAEKRIDAVMKKEGSSLTLEQLIKIALKSTA